MPQPPTEQGDEKAPELPAWSLARQGVGIALWASFLAAAAASVVCFAFIDPAEINALPSLDTPLARSNPAPLAERTTSTNVREEAVAK